MEFNLLLYNDSIGSESADIVVCCAAAWTERVSLSGFTASFLVEPHEAEVMNCLLCFPIVEGGMGFFSLVLCNMFQKLEPHLLAGLLKGCEAWRKIVEATVRYCAKM